MSRKAFVFVVVCVTLAMVLAWRSAARGSSPCRANERLAYVTVEDGPDMGRYPVCNEVEVVP
jgi:hypothetical protein